MVGATWCAALRQGLNEAGYIEGQNVAIEYRWAENRIDRLPALAADLVRRQCAVIIAGGQRCSARGQGGDSDDSHRVRDRRRPGQNWPRGQPQPARRQCDRHFLHSGADLVAKQLELLREVVPKAAVIGMLVNPTSAAAEVAIRNAEAAARVLGSKFTL